MIKLSIEDFIYEVKDEIISYEDLGEKKAQEWEKNFIEWLNNNKVKKKNIKVKNNKMYYLLQDESQIFDIADDYYTAVEENREDKYWKNFK